MSAERLRARGLAAATMLALVGALAGAASLADAATSGIRLMIPQGADQLIVVSSPTADTPAPRHLATLRAYERASASERWRQVFGPWQAETGWGHLLSATIRREGDGATPIGVFGIGATLYGNRPNPGDLHYAYHRLVCGDWWDEDPYSRLYNRFVHVWCGVSPGFASWSEPLWTETTAYPYLAVIRFNVNPVRSGPRAPGSGIFLHSWVAGPTNGCVAVHLNRLLRLLRWLRPSAHPVIAIGTNDALTPAPPGQ